MTIADRGVISSETSRRVSSTACWSSSRVDSGRSASASSGWSPSAGISTSTLAGRGAASGGAGEPLDQRLDLARCRRSAGAVSDPERPRGGPEAVDHPLGEDPADRPPPARSRRPRPPARSPARPRPPGAARAASTRTPSSAASIRPVTTASASAARSVRSSWCATSSARPGWPRRSQSVFEPAPRIGPQRLGQRDRDQVQRQDQQAQAERPAQVQTVHRALSRSPSVGLGEAGHRGERVRQALPGQDLALATPHRVARRRRPGRRTRRDEANRGPGTAPARPRGRRPASPRGRRGHLGRDDQLAGQLGVAGLGEAEADHVGRPVVAEVAAVDRVDRRVVDQGDRDRRAVDPLGREHAPRRAGRAPRGRPPGAPGCR